MNSKERFDFMVANMPEVYKNTAESIIEDHVNDLISALFIPLIGHQRNQVDKVRLELFGINMEMEPINWGDLKCCEVKAFKDGTYLVTIEEASSGYCPTLCSYIETYVKSYGWEIQVQTEW